MNTIGIKKVYLYFSAVFAFMLHLPFAFGNQASNIFKKSIKAIVTADSSAAAPKFATVYDSLKLNINGLSEHAYIYAIKGYNFLKATGKIANTSIISIVDFTKPSNQKRLFVIDLQQYKLLYKTYVAHGQGSGALMATNFSNVPESFQSSLGFFKTSTPYMGKNGFSLHLEGMEKGINDKAYERSIVIHGANYVSQNYIDNTGSLGRSWGCPALPENVNKPIIEKIKNGSCLFIFSENKKYLNKSAIINS